MSRPKLTFKEATDILKTVRPHVDGDEAPFLLAIRGYYRDTMGRPEANDINIYDDAIFVMGPDCMVAFNSNTDPSEVKKRKDGKGMAVMKAGVWKYKLGIHHGHKSSYPALVQAAEIEIRRVASIEEFDSGGGEVERGMFGVNIHRGGSVSTGSEGCQTIPAPQWDAFYELVKHRMNEAGAETIDYVLVDWHGGK